MDIIIKILDDFFVADLFDLDILPWIDEFQTITSFWYYYMPFGKRFTRANPKKRRFLFDLESTPWFTVGTYK